MTEILRVLTVWQPWASLIIAGAKPYEFRSHRPPRTIVGQRIVIHAAARKIDTLEVCAIMNALKAREVNPDEAAETCLHPELALPVLEQALRGELPLGVGLGTAICGEGRSGYDIAEEFGLEHVNYGWPLTEIERWPEPIAARGSQGIWFWPTPGSVAL